MLCEEVTRTLSGGPYRSQGSSAVAAPKKGPVCPGNETESQLCQVFNGGEMILLWRPRLCCLRQGRSPKEGRLCR